MNSLIDDMKHEVVSYLDYGMLITVIPLINKNYNRITKTQRYKELVDKELSTKINYYLDRLKNGIYFKFYTYNLYDKKLLKIYPCHSYYETNIISMDDKIRINLTIHKGTSEVERLTYEKMLLIITRLIRLNPTKSF